MATTPTPTNTTPSVNQNSASSRDVLHEGQLSAELKAAKDKVAEEERWDGYARKGANLSLLAYVIVSIILAAFTYWSSRTNARLRNAEKLLNSLQGQKIRADSERQTKVETEKVRQDAARELELKARELDAIAAARVEYVKGHAEATVEKARAEARRQIGLVKKEVEEQRERAAEQEERAAKAESDVLELRERARSRRFWNEKVELAIREKRPTGSVLVTYDANVVDAPNVSFDIRRTLERMGWNVTTRATDATDLPRGADGVTIFAWKLDECPSSTTFCALWDLFCLSSLKDWHCGLDAKLPEDSFRIEVLARPLLPPIA